MAYCPTKDEHRQQMLEYLARDIASAKAGKVVIGFKIAERDDHGWFHGDCTRVAMLEGLYLPDDLPDLYPADCPNEGHCCCISRMEVLSCDDTPDSRLLRARASAGG